MRVRVNVRARMCRSLANYYCERVNVNVSARMHRSLAIEANYTAISNPTNSSNPINPSSDNEDDA